MRMFILTLRFYETIDLIKLIQQRVPIKRISTTERNALKIQNLFDEKISGSISMLQRIFFIMKRKRFKTLFYAFIL